MSDVSCMCSVMVGLLLLCWCCCVGLDAMVCFLLFDVWCMFKSSSMLLRCSSLFVPCACSFWRRLASQACGVPAESQEPAFFRLRWQTLAGIFFDEQQNLKSLLARGWQAFWPKKSNDEQIYCKANAIGRGGNDLLKKSG